MELMQASTQWASRPADQRFLSLTDMSEFTNRVRQNSVAKVLATRDVHAAPVEGSRDGLVVIGPNGAPVAPTNWSFGQLAQRAGAPAGYMRDLSPAIAADCINYGLKMRDVEEVGVLLTRDGGVNTMAAMTGPNYGRIWNHRIIDSLRGRFGDGTGTDGGHFKVPGEFGKDVPITKQNTTLYASDRDMFVFLADEKNKIEVPNRRSGEAGELSRGFFIWNSEVGSQSFGIATFLFDYVCMNRIVWGAQGFEEVRFRHTSGAPHRFIEQVAPALERYSEASTAGITQAITDARAHRLEGAQDVDTFLGKRFAKGEVAAIKAAHLADEGRPIETLWDATTGITAYARGIEHQDRRVGFEREAGKVFSLAS